MDEIKAISAVGNGRKLTPEEMVQVARLAARDREVRIHEAQHLAASGGMAASVQYNFELGPDGRMYAVGGQVKMTVSPGRTPEETLAKARQLRAAATAPADPSDQDLSVAARASAMEFAALEAIAAKQTESALKAVNSRRQHPLGLDRMA